MTSDRLNVTAGLRVEHLVRGALEADPAAFDPRPPFGRQAATSVNPKVAVSVLLTRPDAAAARTRVRAAAGTGIRPPDVFEIAFTDNPRLQPERSKSFEAGVEQQLAGGAVAIDAAAFFNRYDDLIVTVGRSMADASHYRTDNISNARARGLELSARARLPKGVTASAVYTRLATAILSVDGFDAVAPAPFAVGDELIRRPRHSGSIDLTYAAARLSAFVSLTSRSRILDLEPNYGAFGGLFFAPGYAVVDAGAAVPVRRGLELFVRVGNVTGRRYEETLGFPALGRSAIGGARVAAGR
jgi:outer membrane receptor protein involved in Fe transport